MPSTTARFIVVTGCNGVGKSTVAEALRAATGGTVFHYPREFVEFRENVELDTAVSPIPRLLYYLAATLHLSDHVRQKLAEGPVYCDRYLESPASLLIAEGALSEDDVHRISGPYVPYLLRPDLTLLLTASHQVACQRIRARRPHRSTLAERRVLESESFHRRREVALRTQAAALGPVAELDTTSVSERAMCDAALALVQRARGEAGAT